MSRARRRTWALGALDREGIYRLWFDPTRSRWEVRSIEDESGTVTTSDDSGAVWAPSARASGRQALTPQPDLERVADHG